MTSLNNNPGRNPYYEKPTLFRFEEKSEVFYRGLGKAVRQYLNENESFKEKIPSNTLESIAEPFKGVGEIAKTAWDVAKAVCKGNMKDYTDNLLAMQKKRRNVIEFFEEVKTDFYSGSETTPTEFINDLELLLQKKQITKTEHHNIVSSLDSQIFMQTTNSRISDVSHALNRDYKPATGRGTIGGTHYFRMN